MSAATSEAVTVGRWTPEVAAAVRAAAEDAGFHLSGIASAESAPPESGLGSFATYLDDWIAAGRAGEMEYLKRRDASGALLRGELRTAIPWARSVVVCALDYSSSEPLSTDPAPPTTGWIGRYAWSGRRQPDGTLAATDYHGEMLARLRLVEARLLALAPCQTRCYVDTGPLVERSFAARAGIGWTGKNTCIINQRLGSWLLLGVIVTSLDVPAESAPAIVPAIVPAIAADRCGSCTRCIDACPTDALVAPREMDASRCIAYLTIEKKGAIDAGLREGMGRQIFGCDICQDVCPWNQRHRTGNHPHAAAVTSGMEPRPELVNPSLAWLAELDGPGFKRWFKGSPLERTGRKRLLRNVAIAMGNSGRPEFLPRLESWAEGEDEVLAEAARWAIGRLRPAARPE